MSSFHATSRYPEADERSSQSESPIADSRAMPEFLFRPVTRSCRWSLLTLRVTQEFLTQSKVQSQVMGNGLTTEGTEARRGDVK